MDDTIRIKVSTIPVEEVHEALRAAQEYRDKALEEIRAHQITSDELTEASSSPEQMEQLRERIRWAEDEARKASEKIDELFKKFDRYAMKFHVTTEDREVDETEAGVIFEDAWYSEEGQEFGRVVRQKSIGDGALRYVLDLGENVPKDMAAKVSIPLPAKYGPSSENILRADVEYFAAPVFSGGGYALGLTALLTADPTALVATGKGAGDRWDAVRVILESATEEGRASWVEHGMDPDCMFMFRNNERGGVVSVADFLTGAAYMREALKVVLEATAKPEEPPRQDTNKPHRQYDPNSKVANKMTSPELFGPAGARLNVASDAEKNRGKERQTAVTLSTDDGVELSRPISAFDREVHGAVSTEWVAGNRYVTARQVAKTMTGKKSPTPAQVERVRESIELQRRVMGKIDFRQEARGRKLLFEGEEVTPSNLEGHIINADRVEMKAANGRMMEGYFLYRAPLIYQHAATLGQVVSYPQRLLELGEGSDTESNLILKRQLLRQVYRAKSGGEKSIRFTPDEQHPDRPCLFTRAGVNVEDWDKRKAATDFALSILKGLKEEGEISGFTVNRRKVRGGNPVHGVTIKP